MSYTMDDCEKEYRGFVSSKENLSEEAVYQKKHEENQFWGMQKYNAFSISKLTREVKSGFEKLIDVLSGDKKEPLRYHRNELELFVKSACDYPALVKDEVFDKWFERATSDNFKKTLIFIGDAGTGKNVTCETFLRYIAGEKGREIYRARINCHADMCAGDIFIQQNFTDSRLSYGLVTEAIIKANELYNEYGSEAPYVVIQFDEFTLAHERVFSPLLSFMSNSDSSSEINIDGIKYRNVPNLIIILNGNSRSAGSMIDVSTCENSALLSRGIKIEEDAFNPYKSDYAMEVYENYCADQFKVAKEYVHERLIKDKSTHNVLDMRRTYDILNEEGDV